MSSLSPLRPWARQQLSGDFLKQRAVDETKGGGDGSKAIAFAILYLAETLKER